MLMKFHEGYIYMSESNISPNPITAHENVNVSVSIDVLKLVDIDEDDYSIEIQFEITLNWKEKRATYHNLKENDNLNALTKKGYSDAVVAQCNL